MRHLSSLTPSVLPRIVALAAVVVGAALLPSAASARQERFYIGTYTGGDAKGIYTAVLDTDNGSLGEPTLAAETANPAFLVIADDGKHLYAGNEVNKYKGQDTGSVTALSVEGDGSTLKVLNQEPSGGRGPCHVSIDGAGKHVLVANYNAGTIAALPIAGDGSVEAPSSHFQHTGHSVVVGRQEDPHAHHIISSPSGKYVYATDLGLDKIKCYRWDSAHEKLEPAPDRDIPVQPGTGPRRILFSRAADRVYILGEIASDVSVYTFDERSGRAQLLQTVSLLPADWKGKNTAAEFQLDRDGKHLYASNRGDDSIVVFALQSSGTLQFEQRVSSGGKVPRNFTLDPTGTYLLAANQDTNNIVTFRVDPETGKLTELPHSIHVGKPVALVFR